ncbi:MAG: hypothetical protein JST36_07750 [Bacteroidetes bacterium]|nr:hypothetical protein [Bacteroidota bacterium]
MLAGFPSVAQQWIGSSTIVGTLNRNGEIGLYPNNIARITLGDGYNSMNFLQGYLGFNWARNGGTPGNEWTYTGDGANNGAALVWSDVGGNLYFSTKASNNGTSGSSSDNFIKNSAFMSVKANGKVVIGNPAQDYNISTPGSYKLYVEGGILTEHLRVAIRSTSDWQDQVFEPSYRLMPLGQLKRYIGVHHHLPGIPSAQEVVTQGLDVAEGQSKLLQKLEELTLYLLQQQDYLLQQQDEIEALKRKIGYKKPE